MKRNTTRLIGTSLVLGAGVMLSGCSNGFQGAASGGALGALVGMGLGSLSGDMGKGAAAGALIGGATGAVIGDQNARAGRNYNTYTHRHNDYRRHNHRGW
jgi:uncharacterized protein YcfJ